MKGSIIAIVLGASVVATAALATGKPHWGYSGARGPSHWGTLGSEFELCGIGRNQSPIDLSGFVQSDLPPIEFNYGTDATEIVNNGHAIQANYADGSSISIGRRVFELKQFHFHSPSENRINGKSFPMEGHLVHADENGNLAVVAVLFEEGPQNVAIASLWNQMPRSTGAKYALSSDVNASSLLPANRSYFRFNGSLTTPPCSEGVWWVVMKQPMTLSAEQIALFTDVIGHPNNRPVQPLNARVVLK